MHPQTSVVNGVPIHRPLLPLDKAAIFDFAHRFGVPYFKARVPTYIHIHYTFVCIYICLHAWVV